jgi:hypothetical protein
MKQKVPEGQLYQFYLAFVLDYKHKNTIPKMNIFSYPQPLSFSILSVLFHISFIISLPSPFSISPRSFLSLSLISLHLAQLSLSSHITFCTSFLFYHSISVFSLLVPTSKSRLHFTFFCTLSLQVLRNFLCYILLILPVVSGFSDSFLSFLLVCDFVTITQLYILPSSFCS